MSTDYLKRILTSKVYDVAVESPLEPAPLLSQRLSNTVLLKREDTQAVFSFKLRGAYNKMANLPPAARNRGVIAASAGNHAQGVALAATRLGCRAVIVMPTTSPQVKVDAVRRLGGEVVLAGEVSPMPTPTRRCWKEGKADLRASVRRSRRDRRPGYGGNGDPAPASGSDRRHLRGHRRRRADLGRGRLHQAAAPEIKIIGVQTEDSDAMLRSVRAGRRVQLNDVGLFSDGTAVKMVGAETFKLTRQYVDDFVVVNTDAICAAIRDVFQDTRSVLEPAGAMAVAAAKQYAAEHHLKGKTLVAIACGANMNFDRLRFVSERAEVGEMREAIFAVTMPEQRGSFRRFCELVGERSVTEFNYRISVPTAPMCSSASRCPRRPSPTRSPPTSAATVSTRST